MAIPEDIHKENRAHQAIKTEIPCSTYSVQGIFVYSFYDSGSHIIDFTDALIGYFLIHIYAT